MTDQPTETGTARIAKAYSSRGDEAALQRVAANHDPAHDDDADHIAATPEAPPTARLSAAYQRTQRAAAKQVTTNNRKDAS